MEGVFVYIKIQTVSSARKLKSFLKNEDRFLKSKAFFKNENRFLKIEIVFAGCKIKIVSSGAKIEIVFSKLKPFFRGGKIGSVFWRFIPIMENNPEKTRYHLGTNCSKSEGKSTPPVEVNRPRGGAHRQPTPSAYPRSAKSRFQLLNFT